MIARTVLLVLAALNAARAAAPSARENWTLLLETYALSEADAQSAGAIKRAPGVEVRDARDRVRLLAAAGRADFLSLHAVAAQRGKTSVLASVDEVLLPKEMDSSRIPGAPAYPSGFVAKAFGEVLTFSETTMLGAADPVLEFDLMRFRTPASQFIAHWFDCDPHLPQELNPQHPLYAGGTYPWLPSRVEMCFPKGRQEGDAGPRLGRGYKVGFIEIVHRGMAPPAPRHSVTMQLAWTILSIERTAALPILSAPPETSAWSAARKAVSEGRARVEKILVLETKTGAWATVVEGSTLRGVPHLDPPKYLRLPMSRTAPATNIPATATGFEAQPIEPEKMYRTSQRPMDDPTDPRQAGWTCAARVAPVDGAFTVETVLRFTQSRDDLRDPPAPAHFPPLSIVEARKLETTVAIGAGPVLLGTLNPPPPNGVNERTDDGRAWLVFLTATPIMP